MKKVYKLGDMTKARDEETVETIHIKVSLHSFGGCCSHSHGKSFVVIQQAKSQSPADCTARLKFNRYKLMFS